MQLKAQFALPKQEETSNEIEDDLQEKSPSQSNQDDFKEQSNSAPTDFEEQSYSAPCDVAMTALTKLILIHAKMNIEMDRVYCFQTCGKSICSLIRMLHRTDQVRLVFISCNLS
jgi:hypothetical protein